MADDDWRLRGQEDYLLGATLQLKAYRMWSEKWDHDHCAFCWAKFLDPTAKFTDPKAAAWLANAIEDPEILTEGYAVQGRSPKEYQKSDYWWICPTCVRDFAKRFGWTVQDGPDVT
jgi:hypothetical protein